MRYDVIRLVAGWSLLLLTVPLAISAAIGYIMHDEMNIILWSFVPPIIFCAVVGSILIWRGTRRDTDDRLRDREAFAAVALSWPLIVAVGALPFWLGPTFHGPITWDGDGGTLQEILGGIIRSWFESMSGFTTSGASVWPMKTLAAVASVSLPLVRIVRCITHAIPVTTNGKMRQG